MKPRRLFPSAFLVALLLHEPLCHGLLQPAVEEEKGAGGRRASPLQLLDVLRSDGLDLGSDLSSLARDGERLALLREILPDIISGESKKGLWKVLQGIPPDILPGDTDEEHQQFLKNLVLPTVGSGNTDRSLPPWVIQIIVDYVEGLISKYYLPIGNNINEACKTTTDDYFSSLREGELWAIKMMDSWGKLPDGFLFGNMHPVGMYEECLKINANYTTLSSNGTEKDVEFTGRYCSITFGKKSSSVPNSGIAFAELLEFPLGYATCIPSLCSAEDLMISLNETLAENQLDIVRVNCHSEEDESEDLTQLDNLMLSLISILLILVVIATFYDGITLSLEKPHLREGLWQALIGFSFYHNMKAIFTYKVSSYSDGISCLPALRVITMTWIIICHQYEADAAFISNTLDVLKYQDPVIGQLVTNGWLAVDTFLFLTGLVISYRVFPHVKIQAGSYNFILFGKTFVRRFFRLAPTIMFVGMFSASLLRYLGSGPISYRLTDFSEECQDYWWRDALFINNYIMGENDGLHFKDCLHHCWYTAVDLQLLLTLPILLLPIASHKRYGGLLFGAIFIGSIIVPLAITIIHNLPPSPLHYMSLEDHFEYTWRVFLVPWCRAGPWMVGIGTGVLLRDDKITKIKLHKFVVFCGYVMAIAIGFILVLAIFPFNHVFPDKNYKDYPAISAAYGSLARPVWGLCVAWVVFCCHTKNSVKVNRLLSYPGWRPLAKLTFAMYLVAPVIQTWWTSSRLLPNYFNYLEKLFQSLGITFMAGLIGLAVTCLVERPFFTILNLILPSEAQKKESLAKILESHGGAPSNSELVPITLEMEEHPIPPPQTSKAAQVSYVTSPFGSAPPGPIYHGPPFPSSQMTQFSPSPGPSIGFEQGPPAYAPNVPPVANMYPNISSSELVLLEYD